ncbi:MAG: CinA family nicotinamide mononucleotide deamidase-related protein [Deltaproteobacteria bacterium]|nr:CinA family nicotinamide mononucleotide deamidase-related protein [Deltaproteobacteria bacterium]
MRGELIIIGDEILDGRVANTNGNYLAGRLAAVGLGVSRITTIGDREEDMARVLGHAARLADFVLVTGGLGSTDDDLTTAVAARAFDRPLTLRQDILDRIRAVCRAQSRPVDQLERLAWLPQGARPLSETHYCGFFLVQGNCLFCFLPGVPEEVRDLFEQQVLPLLLERFAGQPLFRQRIIKLLGLTESQAAALMSEVPPAHPQVAFGSYPNFPEVHLSLTVQGSDPRELDRILDQTEADLQGRLGRFIFGRDNETLASVLGWLLKDKGLTLATAESCTGGRAAQMITSVPGSSAYFIEGVVSYANRAKEDLLGVQPGLLEAHGAVSPQVAAAMAQGLKKRAKVDLAVSVTGIAGPEGGSPDKPVGTVFLGLAAADRTVVEGCFFGGGRERIQIQAAAKALDLCRRLLLLGENR